MERNFNGALSLLSILIAVFTFAFTRYLDEEGSYVTQTPYRWLLILCGCMLVMSGVSAIIAHIQLGSERSTVLHYLFGFLLLVATLLPAIFWFLQ
jgi:hypothetical protein